VDQQRPSESAGPAGGTGRTPVGVIGAGAISHDHLRAWGALGADLHLFSTGSRGPATAAQHGAVLHPDLDSLIAAVDIVDVCTPTPTHAQLVLAAAAAGRQVICEKPIALTRVAAAGMIAACAAAGVQLHVGQVLRYFHAYAGVRDAVAAGRLGRVSGLRLERRVSLPDAAWFSDEDASGGVIVDLMIHDIDYARWVAGEVTTVRATMTTDPGGTVTADAELDHAGGAVSRLTAAWDAAGQGLRTALAVRGSAAAVAHDAATPDELRWSTPDGAEPVAEHLPAGPSPFHGQLAEFLGAIRGGPPPRVNPADAFAALDIALAARESARTGAPVILPGMAR
jgi:myo-inositol 2-dehydrogenase/D-chiro-inositol 1-dehydrogenase